MRILVVGAGLTGATCARLLADKGHEVHLKDRRLFVGGNCADYVHQQAHMLINRYGPHYFRTNSEKIWRFVQRFAEWKPWAAEVLAFDGREYQHWPVTVEWCEKHPTIACPEIDYNTFKGAALSILPPHAYKAFVEGYTEKQWGVPCDQLSYKLAQRLELRVGDDRRLKQSQYQALPVGGYTRMIERMLSGTQVELGRECDDNMARGYDKVIWTGPIDAFFNYAFGELRYRTQTRVNTWHPNVQHVQPAVQINYPQTEVPIIRSIDWSYTSDVMSNDERIGTVITTETPGDAESEDQYEYPFPDEANAQLYNRYRDFAATGDYFATEDNHVIFGGRLGTYRYLDMDAAIGHAMALVEKNFE